MSDYIPNPQNLPGKAQSRTIWQYRNGPKFQKWISILPNIGERDIGQAANDVASLINLDTATGEALNICGRIANIERPVIPEVQLDDVYYLTSLNDEPPQLGDDGAQMVSLESAIPTDAQDDVYRRLIRAKISVNTSDATIDSIAQALAQVVGADDNQVRVVDYQDMTFEIVFLGGLEPVIRFVLTNYPLTPRPQGVKLRGYVEEPEYMQLGADWQMGDEFSQLTPIYIS